MGIPSKAAGGGSKRSSGCGGGDHWGSGFLLVFFPDEDEVPIPPPSPDKLLPCSPSSAGRLTVSPPSSFRRSGSGRRLITKAAQSTISICALLVFITLLVFTLSTFEPASTSAPTAVVPRRLLSPATGEQPRLGFWFPKLWAHSVSAKHQFALQGMGTLYRRGTRAMNDLVVAHLEETAAAEELRLFLRAMLRSPLMSRADLVIILCSKLPSFDVVVGEEMDSFSQLILRYGELNGTAARKAAALGGFDVAQFTRPMKSKSKVFPEPMWGKRTRRNYSEAGDGGLPRVSYGSVVSFEAAELDPENSLIGFLDHVPMSLRRWACYQMLLGRVRRNFKHVMLVDAKTSVVLGDPLSRVRAKTPETVHLINKPDVGSSRHGRKNSDKSQGGIHGAVNPGLIMGGARGVRRLAAAMLTEVVRAAMQHKKKGSVTELAVLSQLTGNEHLLRNVEMVRTDGPPPDVGLSGGRGSEFAVVQRGNGLNGLITKLICSCEIDSSVYKDC